MDRERAEAHLRLLAEAELRGSALRSGNTTRVARVARVLTAVGALDERVAARIVADFELAAGARPGLPCRSPSWINELTPPGRGPLPSGYGRGSGRVTSGSARCGTRWRPRWTGTTSTWPRRWPGTGRSSPRRARTGIFGNYCGWGGWGGSMVMVDPDARLTVSYVMNQMLDQGILGDDRGLEIVIAASGVLG